MFNDWTIQMMVMYPARCVSVKKVRAERLAFHADIPCLPMNHWKWNQPIRLEVDLRFNPKDDLIVGNIEIPISELCSRVDLKEYSKHLRETVVENTIDFIRKELYRKLGWT